MELDLKIVRMHHLGITQERISKMLGVPQQTIFRLFTENGNVSIFGKY